MKFKNRFLRDIKPYSFRDWEYLNSRGDLSKTAPIEANDLFRSV